MEWKLPDGVDRMVVNAALTTLTERWDADAARLVVYAFSSLPEIRPDQTTIVTRFMQTRTKVRGLTPEHGMVNIYDREQDHIEQVQGPPRNSEAAIGSFKIVNIRTPGSGIAMVAFRPFQEDPLSLIGEHVPQSMFAVTFIIERRAPTGLFRFDYVPFTPPFWRRFRGTVRGLWTFRGHPFRNTFTEAAVTVVHRISKDELAAIFKQ